MSIFVEFFVKFPALDNQNSKMVRYIVWVAIVYGANETTSISQYHSLCVTLSSLCVTFLEMENFVGITLAFVNKFTIQKILSNF